MTTFLVVNVLTGAVAVECAVLETLDLIMADRGPEFVAIMSTKTLYDSPLDHPTIFAGIATLAAYRQISKG